MEQTHSRPVAFSFSCELPPTLNEYQIPLSRGRKMKGFSARSFAKSLAKLFMATFPRSTPLVGPVGVRIVFSLLNRSDIDNRVKSLLDSLQGLAFENDNQVVYLEVIKVVVKHLDERQAQVEIFEVDPV